MDTRKADDFSESFGTKAFYDVADLFGSRPRADVAVICSPNGLHAFHSMEALKAGYHVLCEKPMAIRKEDCMAMMEAARTAGKQLIIVKQNRFNPPVAALKKVVEEGKLGRIFNVQVNCFWNRNTDYYSDGWRGRLDLDGGTLFTQFSHFIDLLHWIAGDVAKVNAILANYMHKGIIEFEDTGVVLFEFDNGAIGSLNFTVNSHHKNMEGSITVFGEKGTVKVGGQYLNELGYQDIEDHAIPSLHPGNRPNDYGSYTGSMSNHEKVYENLIDVLTCDKEPAAHGRDGLKTVEIIEKIYQSANRI